MIACASDNCEFPPCSCLQIVWPILITSSSPMGHVIGPWPQPSPLALSTARKLSSFESARAGPTTASDAAATAVAITMKTPRTKARIGHVGWCVGCRGLEHARVPSRRVPGLVRVRHAVRGHGRRRHRRRIGHRPGSGQRVRRIAGASVVVGDVDGPASTRPWSLIRCRRWSSRRRGGRTSSTTDGIGALITLAARDDFGPVDVYVANAGIIGAPGLGDDEADWDRIIDVNLRAHVRAAKALVPEWIERGTRILRQPWRRPPACSPNSARRATR